MEKESGTNLKEDTLLGKIVRKKKKKKRLENVLSQQKQKIKQMETQEKSMVMEAQTLRAKIGDLNALISELKGKIEEQEQKQKQVVSAYEQQTDKIIAERTKYMKLTRQYKEAFETEKNELAKANAMIDRYRETNSEICGVLAQVTRKTTFTPHKILIRIIQEMEEIEK